MQSRIVFIHGFMGHPSDWDDVRNDLSEYETSAVEVKESADWKSSIHQLAETIPDDSVVVGYSMGARLALGLALQFPRKCKVLVFVSGNPGLESEADRTKRWQSDRQIASRIQGIDPSDVSNRESLEMFLNDWYESDVFAASPESVRQNEIQAKRANWTNQWPDILRANSVARQPNYWPRLTELSMPVLVVAGQDDAKYRNIAIRIGEVIANQCGNVKLIQDCGHIVHREQQELFVETIREFLKSTN